jgi:antitoxin HigA-1
VHNGFTAYIALSLVTGLSCHHRLAKPVTADTALRLGKFFKTGAAFWMNIQARFDLETAEGALAPQIKKIAPYEAA